MKKAIRLTAAVLCMLMLVSAMSVMTLAAPIRYELTADMIQSVNINCYLEENWDGELVGDKFIYNYADYCSGNIQLKNGNSAYVNGETVYYNYIEQDIVTYSDTQSETPWTVDGENTATATIFGVDYTVNVSVSPEAEDPYKTEGDFVYEDMGDSVSVVGYIGESDTIVIPETLGGKPVTEVYDLAVDFAEVKKIEFPQGVETLTDWFFYCYEGNSAIEELVFGSKISLDFYSEYYFPNLKKITIKGNSENYTVKDGIVYNKDMTAIVIFPRGKTGTYNVPASLYDFSTIPTDADAVVTESDHPNYKVENGLVYETDTNILIYSSKNISGKITVKEGTAAIGMIAFAGRENVTEVVLPDTVTNIAYASFMGCTNLASVTSPTKLEGIGASAFQNCVKLDFVPADSVSFIGESAFSGSGIKNAVLPASLEYLGDAAFAKTNVTTAHIPAIEEMGGYVYRDTKVTSFTVAEGVDTIPYGTFKKTPMTDVKIPDGVTVIGSRAFEDSEVKTLDLNKTERIGYAAFAGTKLEELVLTPSVEFVDSEAFIDCDSLVSIKFNDKISDISEVFMYCDGLKEVHIPATIEYMYSAFSFCKNLSKVTFDKGVKLQDAAFYGCDMSEADLTGVEGVIPFQAMGNISAVGVNVPATVTELTYASFANSENLAYVGIPKEVQGIHPYAFDECDSLNHVFYTGSEAEWTALASGREDDNLTAATKHYNTEIKVEKKDTPATCTEEGKVEHICTICKAVISTQKSAKTDHVFGEYVSDNNATTQKDGTKTAKCKNCDATDTITDVGTKLELQDTTKVFSDVKAKKWYTKAVNYAYSNGFISGMTSTDFGLNTNLTRGMFITILARIAGVDTSSAANKAATTKFTDVKVGKYFTNAIRWGNESGIVAGMTDTTFEPNTNITREQLCVMIAKFAEVTGITLTETEEALEFTDAASVAKWAKKSIALCQKADIVNGYKVDGKYEFRPKNTATRAEAAQILYVFHMDFFSVEE